MPHRVALLILTVLIAGALTGACGSDDSSDDDGTFTLGSPAFGEGDRIPGEHALDGVNISPPLSWSGVPDDAVELALSVVDPDVSNFVHWVVWSIEPTDAAVEAGALPPGSIQGRNQFGEIGWGGPQPPAGTEHTYVFTLHALERPSGLAEGATSSEALRRIRELTTETAELRAQFRAP